MIISILTSTINLLLVLLALYFTVRHFKQARASAYIERFNSPEAIEMRATVDKWLDDCPSNTARLLTLNADPVLATTLASFANLFQELGVAYDQGIVSKAAVADTFDGLVVRYWQSLRFWINDSRLRNPAVYNHFEKLYDIMKAKRQKRPEMEGDVYLFAYGSLMHPQSATAALRGRCIDVADLIPATLLGYRRVWAASDLVHAQNPDYPVRAVFLDIEKIANSASMTGTLLKLKSGDLDRLKKREKNYSTLDVTESIRTLSGKKFLPASLVYSFISKEVARVSAEACSDCAVMKTYIDTIEEALAIHGDEFRDRYIKSTSPSEFSVVEGQYVFTDKEQAKLV